MTEQSEPSRRRVDWRYAVVLAVMAVGFLSIGVDTALHFKDTPIDGPFQLFNALRRLAAGQHFGGSFQYFHGPGVPYLHFIPFLLLGRSFVASELSRELVSTGAAILVTIAFFRAWTRDWREAIPLAVIGLVMLIPMRVNALIFPINSMLGLRATMPIVVAIHLLLRGTGWRAIIERGLLFGVTIACGIEQGTATIVAYGLVMALTSLRRRDVRPVARAVVAAAIGPAAFVLFAIAISPHGFASILQFNFRSVPGDQFWFFGGPPNRFLYRWSQLSIFISTPVWTTLVGVMVVWTLRRFWTNASLDEPEIVAEAFLVIYAVASCGSMLGTWNLVYFQPAVRVCLFLAIIAARREWLTHRLDPRIPPEVRPRIPRYAVATVFVAAIVGWPQATIAIVRTPLHIVYAHWILGEPPSMDPEWVVTESIGRQIVAREAAGLGHTPVIWSTYASIVEYDAGVFHPFFDYIIHALGHDNRVAYSERFVAARPDIVQTLRPTYSNYEEWLEMNYWSFYRALFRDYSIAQTGPWSYFWLRRPAPWDERPEVITDVAVPAGQLGIMIPVSGVAPGEPGLFEITLRYHVHDPLGRIPVVGSLPRYMVHVGNSLNRVVLSLSPHETTRVFPVLVDGPTSIRLLGDPVSLVGRPTLVFDSLRVVRLRLAPDNLRWAADFAHGPTVSDTTHR